MLSLQDGGMTTHLPLVRMSRGWGPIVSLHQSWSDILGWRQTSIWHQLRGPTWSWCLFWMGGGWGHQPEAFLYLASMWWPGCTAADGGASSGGMQGPLWDFLGWSSQGAYGPSPQWMSFHTGTCGIFHNHIQWLTVLSWCWHNRSQYPWGTCSEKLWAVHPGWCRLLAPWARHHTEGWPVCSNHSISGVSGGLSAVGTLFSGSTSWVFSSQAKQFSFLRRAWRGSVFELRWGTNGCR